jgi:hypothetical protein
MASVPTSVCGAPGLLSWPTNNIGGLEDSAPYLQEPRTAHFLDVLDAPRRGGQHLRPLPQAQLRGETRRTERKGRPAKETPRPQLPIIRRNVTCVEVTQLVKGMPLFRPREAFPKSAGFANAL